MPYLDTQAGRLFYRTAGQGPAILLWHSWLGNGSIWDPQVDALARKYRVIVVDGPCHGRSECRRFTLEHCADAVVDVLNAEDIDGALLGGLSWGGMTVMRTALRAPERVRGLALLGTTAQAEPFHNILGCQFFAQTVHRFGFVRPMTGASLSIMFGETTLRTRKNIVQQEIRRLRELNCAGIRWSTRAIVSNRRSILNQLERLRVPTLVAVGAEDRCLPPVRSELIARTIPGAELHVLPHVGHLLPVEAPVQVTRLLCRFAEDVFGAAGATAA